MKTYTLLHSWHECILSAATGTLSGVRLFVEVEERDDAGNTHRAIRVYNCPPDLAYRTEARRWDIDGDCPIRAPINPVTGQISGVAPTEPGEHKFTLRYGDDAAKSL